MNVRYCFSINMYSEFLWNIIIVKVLPMYDVHLCHRQANISLVYTQKLGAEFQFEVNFCEADIRYVPHC